MGSPKYKYLGDKNWDDITRDERTFCALLYESFRERPDDLVDIIVNSKNSLKHLANDKALDRLKKLQDWTLNYEVCFYRDLLKFFDLPVKESAFPQKRTWDLTLFSSKAIVLIEAKVHENLDRKQLNDLCKDKWGEFPHNDHLEESYSVKNLIAFLQSNKKMLEQDPPEVFVVLLMPQSFFDSKYFGNNNSLSGEYIKRKINGKYLIDSLISWQQLVEGSDGFLQAMLSRANLKAKSRPSN